MIDRRTFHVRPSASATSGATRRTASVPARSFLLTGSGVLRAERGRATPTVLDLSDRIVLDSIAAAKKTEVP
jgi:hypothetical protein